MKTSILAVLAILAATCTAQAAAKSVTPCRDGWKICQWGRSMGGAAVQLASGQCDMYGEDLKKRFGAVCTCRDLADWQGLKKPRNGIVVCRMFR